MRILVTGASGFIGFHLCKKLIENGNSVLGIDNFNNYYDKSLKISRKDNLIKRAKRMENDFEIIEVDIEDNANMKEIFKKFKPSVVINLAAQAGVRYSITNPESYIKSNLNGFAVILECCRRHKI